MKTGARQRWAVLIALLTAALSAAAWVREGDRTAEAEVVEAPARQARPASAAPVRKDQAAAERVHLEKMRTHPATDRTDDAFAPRSWRKAAPKPAAAANAVIVAPPQSAPPLPFVYMGKLLSEDARAVFLTQGERNLIAIIDCAPLEAEFAIIAPHFGGDADRTGIDPFAQRAKGLVPYLNEFP